MRITVNQLNLPQDERDYLIGLELIGEEVESSLNATTRIIIGLSRKLKKLEDDFKELEKQKQ